MMFIKFAAFQLQQLGLRKQKERESRSSQEKELLDKDNTECESEKEKGGDEIEPDEAKKIVESITESITGDKGDKQELEESTKEIVRKAALAVGSLKETEFDVRFNPDVYSPGVVHLDSDGERLKKERQLVKDAATFLLMTQIPQFLRDCLDHTAAPLDGTTFSEALHTRGINIRYFLIFLIFLNSN